MRSTIIFIYILTSLLWLTGCGGVENQALGDAADVSQLEGPNDSISLDDEPIADLATNQLDDDINTDAAEFQPSNAGSQKFSNPVDYLQASNNTEGFDENSSEDIPMLASYNPRVEYQSIASNGPVQVAPVATSGLGLSDVNYALSNQGGADHAARHLSESGLLEGSPNSKTSRVDFKKHASRILSNPDAVIYQPEGLKRGQVPVKGYLGKIKGQDVIVWVAQESGGKRFKANQIVTAYTPSKSQLSNYRLTVNRSGIRPNGFVSGGLLRGAGRVGSVVALDQGSEAIINNIPHEGTRELTRAGKEGVLLYNFPISSLMNLQGSTPQRVVKQVDSTTRISYPSNIGTPSYEDNPNAPENAIYVERTEPKQECYDSQRVWDVTKWRLCSRPNAFGKPQRYGVATLNGQQVLVPYGSVAGI